MITANNFLEKYIKPIFNNLQSVVIVALIIIIILMRTCGGNNCSDIENTVVTKVETKYIPVTKDIVQYVPKWKTKVEIDLDTVEVFINNKVDTVEILKDYFSKYFYVDTVNLDTFGYIVVKDTISKNSIISRDINSRILVPTTTITQIKTINKLEFYAGLGLAASIRPLNLNYAGAEFLLRTKKKQAYGIGIGLDQQLHPVISGRAYWKIGK